jgi:hypothetical protein
MILEEAFQFAKAFLLLPQNVINPYSQRANAHVSMGINVRRCWLACEKRSNYREQPHGYGGEAKKSAQEK